MPNVADLTVELEESVALTGLVISDLNILNNIVFPVKAAVDLFVLYQAKSNLLFDYLSASDRLLLVMSKLPIVGGPLGAIRFVGKNFNESLDNVSKTLSVIDQPLDIVDKAMTTVSISLPVANLSANAALEVNSARIDVLEGLEALGVIETGSELSGITEANFDQLVLANDITRAITDETEPLRDALGVLDLSVFGVLEEGLVVVNDSLDKSLALFEPFAEALDKLNDAIEPVEWALDAASSVVDAVVNPVIEAVLGATGLNELIDDLSAQIFGDLSLLEDLESIADRVRVELENNDVAGLVNGFWDEFSVLFDVGGGIDLANTIGVFEIENGGAVNVIGTNGDDSLTGTDGDDNFAPLEGDDTIDGLAGTDRAFFLKNIEDYRVEFVVGTDGVERIQVSPRAEETAREGVDLLENIELLRFANPIIGDVTPADIRQFLYTEPGQPDLTGDDQDNWLFGDTADNILIAAGGDDTLFGGDGDDDIRGGAGGDLVFAGDGDDTVLVDVRAGDTQVDTVFGGDGVDEIVVLGDLDLTVDFETGAVDFGAPGVMPFFEFERFVSGSGDDLFLGADGAQTIIGGGGNDTLLYAGEGDEFYSTNSASTLEGVATVSFRDGGYAGVRIEAIESDSSLYEREILHEELDPGAVLPGIASTSLFGVEIVEGTDFADVFYALGVTQGQVSGLPEYTITHNAETFTLDGSAFFGGAGTDVFFASELGSLFDGGEGFDLVNFNLDYTIADRLSEGGIQSFTIDLESGLATGLLNQGIAKSDIYLRNIEGVVGTRSDDVIIGNAAANYLNGYQGRDTIYGGDGADYIDASGLIGAELYGEAGNDIFALGPSENAMIDGGDGSDVLELKPDQAFRLDAFFDQEALGSGGSDLENVAGWAVDLSAGFATSEFLEAGVDPNNNVPFTYTASLTSIENVLGSDFSDTISGNADDNLLLGRAGDDLISGGAGDDNLNGGEGDDTLLGGDGDDVLFGGTGQDSMTGGAGSDQFLLAPEDAFDIISDFNPVEDLLSVVGLGVTFEDISLAANGTGTDVIVGTRVVATLLGVTPAELSEADFVFPDPAPDDPGAIPVGTDGDDFLDATASTRLPGDDGVAVAGLEGDDTILGGAGDDTLSGNGGADEIVGNAGADEIFGGQGNDSLAGGDDDDTLEGGTGDDLLRGQTGNDLGDGGDGDDEVRGGMGYDTLFGGAGNDNLRGDEGNDVLAGGGGNDTITGNDGDDDISGGDGDDSLLGGNGNDTISGGDGNDVLSGGADRDLFEDVGAGDTIDGGTGDSNANDVNDDFDTLDLSGLGPLRVVGETVDADGNSTSGTVEFLDGAGAVTGTLEFAEIENIIPCFTPGTVIATANGERLVEELREGDRIITRDNCLQKIRWVGRRDLSGRELLQVPHLKPVLIRAGSLGRGLPERDMVVSPNHRLLMQSDRSALYFADREVLAAAKHLTGLGGVDRVETSAISYIHFMFDQHEVVLSNGAWTESFQPGEQVLDGIGDAQRDEIFELFPELREAEGIEAYQAARRSLKKHEARLLFD